MATFKQDNAILYNKSKEFWEDYQRGRVKIPQSFYERFYTFHAAHGGAFDTVHDVGAGFGGLSVELAKKFSHVILSDPAAQSIEVARELIKSTCSPERFTLRYERIEDSDLPIASVDAIFSCNAMHWTDVGKAMAVMTRQLKPGGTLYLSFFGIPNFDPVIQPVWWRMIDECLLRAQAWMPKSAMERVLAIQDDGFDAIAISESDYQPDSVRLKFNVFGNPDAFVQSPATADKSLRLSRVRTTEQQLHETDRQWFFDADIDTLRAIVNSYPFNADPEMLDRYLHELELLLDGGTCKAHWPVSIVMATRK